MVVLFGSAGPVLADESGTSFWLLGTYSTQTAVPGDPGRRSTRPTIRRRALTGSFPRRSHRGRRTVPQLFMLTPTYTFRPQLGGQFGFGVTAPGKLRLDRVGDPGRASGRSLSSAGRLMTAFGDLFKQPLKWNSRVNFMAYVTANMPIGAYDVNRRATVGWAVGPDGGWATPGTRRHGCRASPS